MGPQPLRFLLSTMVYPLTQARVSGLRTGRFFCFEEPAEGFGSFYLYVFVYYFLTCLGYIIIGARRG